MNPDLPTTSQRAAVAAAAIPHAATGDTTAIRRVRDAKAALQDVFVAAVLAERAAGASWADIDAACGFPPGLAEQRYGADT